MQWAEPRGLRKRAGKRKARVKSRTSVTCNDPSPAAVVCVPSVQGGDTSLLEPEGGPGASTVHGGNPRGLRPLAQGFPAYPPGLLGPVKPQVNFRPLLSDSHHSQRRSAAPTRPHHPVHAGTTDQGHAGRLTPREDSPEQCRGPEVRRSRHCIRAVPRGSEVPLRRSKGRGSALHAAVSEMALSVPSEGPGGSQQSGKSFTSASASPGCSGCDSGAEWQTFSLLSLLSRQTLHFQ